jgi:phage gp36-like protein
MPYSTLTDIEDVIPQAFVVQLTNDTGGATVDQAKVDKAISDADELIDGFLRGRYTLPLSSLPNLVRKFSVDIAVFNLYSRRPELETPENVVTRYKDALKLLEQIQKGLVTLGIAGAQTPEPGEFKTNKTEEDRIFNKETLDQF